MSSDIIKNISAIGETQGKTIMQIMLFKQLGMHINKRWDQGATIHSVQMPGHISYSIPLEQKHVLDFLEQILSQRSISHNISSRQEYNSLSRSYRKQIMITVSPPDYWVRRKIKNIRANFNYSVDKVGMFDRQPWRSGTEEVSQFLIEFFSAFPQLLDTQEDQRLAS